MSADGAKHAAGTVRNFGSFFLRVVAVLAAMSALHLQAGASDNLAEWPNGFWSLWQDDWMGAAPPSSQTISPQLFELSLGRLPPTLEAAAVTSTWIGATSGAWESNANWTNVPAMGGFPNNGNGGVATYDAVINATGSTYTITLSSSVTVENLLLNSANATLNQSGGTLTANQHLTLSAGTYQLSGGTLANTVVDLSGSGIFSITTASSVLNGVTVNGALTLGSTFSIPTISGGTTFSTAHVSGTGAGFSFAPGQTLSGTVFFETSAAGGGIEMNGQTGSLTIGTTGVIKTVSGLNGDISVGPGIFRGGSMTLLNQGLISSEANLRTIEVRPTSFTNQGIVQAINGGLVLIDAANWNNGASGTLKALNGSTLSLSGNWSTIGAIVLNNGTLNLGGIFTTTGFNLAGFSNTGGTVNITGTLNNVGNALTLNAATGSWILNGGTISGGSLSTIEGQSLVISSNPSNSLTGLTVLGDLSLNTSAAKTIISGGSTFTTAHLSGNSSELGFAPGQTLTNTIQFEGAGTQVRSVGMNGGVGTFTIGSGGVIKTVAGLGSDAVIGQGFYGGSMALVNQGLISSEVSGHTITVNPVTSFSNQGTVQAMNGGTVQVVTPLTEYSSGTLNGGIWKVFANSTIAGAGIGAITTNGADVTLSGVNSVFASIDSIAVNSGSFHLLAGRNFTTGSSLSNSGTLELGGGNFTIGGAGNSLSNSAPGLIQGFGTIAPGSLSNLGTVTAVGGLLSVTGTVVQFSAGTLSGGNWNVLSNSTLSASGMPGITTNNASVSLTGANSIFTAIDSLAANGGSFAIGGGRNFTTAGALSNSGTLSTGSGSVFGISGLFTWSAGTLNGGGVFNANAGAALSGGAGQTLNGATLANAAGQTTTQNGTGTVTLSNSANLNNAGTYLAQSDTGVATGSGSNVFNNSGTLTRNTGIGTFAIATAFNNTGTVNVSSGTLLLNGTVTQFSAGSLTGGTWNISANSTLGGSGFGGITNNAASVSLSGVNSTFAAFNGLASNSGAFTLAGTRSFTTTGAFADTGTLSVSAGSTFTTTGLFTWTSGTLTGGGIFDANAGVALSGAAGETLNGSTFNSAAGQTVTDGASGGLTLTNGQAFNNAGTFLAQSDGGIANGSGSNTFNNTGTFTRNTSTGTFVVSSGFNNVGIVNVNSGTLLLNGPVSQFSAGTLSGGVWNVSGNSTLGGGGIGPVTTNGATVTLSGTNSVFAAINSMASNTGTFSLAGGRNFTTAGAFANDGTVSAGSGSAFTTSGLFTWSAGVLNGGGSFSANGGLSLNGPTGVTLDGSNLINAAGQSTVVSGTGALSLVNGATFSNAGTFQAQTDAGIISGSGNNVFNNSGFFTRNVSAGIYVIATTFNNGGTVNVASGTLQFNGTVSQVAAGSMFVQGGSMTFNSSFVNDGNVTATGPATLTFNGPLTNNGTILVRGGATLGGSSTSFINNGTIDIITAGVVVFPPGFQNHGVVLDASVVKVKQSSLVGTSYNVVIDSYSGHTYQLQRSTSLSTDTFTNIGATQLGTTGSPLTFTDSSVSATETFYRIIVSP